MLLKISMSNFIMTLIWSQVTSVFLNKFPWEITTRDPPQIFKGGGGHNIKCPPTILGLYNYSLKWGPFLCALASSQALCGLPPPLFFCLHVCHRGWWCTRVPLSRVWKIDPQILKKEKMCHQLFHQDLRDFQAWRRTDKKKLCVPPPPWRS